MLIDSGRCVVSRGCCDKAPPNGRPEQREHVMPAACSPQESVRRWLIPSEAGGTIRPLSLAPSPHAVLPQLVSFGSEFPLLRRPQPHRVRPSLTASCGLARVLKDPLSKRGHVLGGRGLGARHTDVLGGTQPTRCGET